MRIYSYIFFFILFSLLSFSFSRRLDIQTADINTKSQIPEIDFRTLSGNQEFHTLRTYNNSNDYKLVLNHIRDSTRFTAHWKQPSGSFVRSTDATKRGNIITLTFGSVIRTFALLSPRLVKMITSTNDDEPHVVFILKTVHSGNNRNAYEPFFFASRDLLDAFASFLSSIMMNKPMPIDPSVSTIDLVNQAFRPAFNALSKMMELSANTMTAAKNMMLASAVKTHDPESAIETIKRMKVSIMSTFHKYIHWSNIINNIDVSTCGTSSRDNPFNASYIEENIVGPLRRTVSGATKVPVDDNDSLYNTISEAVGKGIGDALMGALDSYEKDLQNNQNTVRSYNAYEMMRMIQIKSIVKTKMTPEITSAFLSALRRSPYLPNAINEAKNNWNKNHEKLISLWMLSIGSLFKDLVFGEDPNAAQAVNRDLANRNVKLDLGEVEIIQSLYSSKVLLRLEKCIERSRNEKNNVWKPSYQFKPVIDGLFSEYLIKTVGIKNTLTITKRDIAHKVGLDITMKDPMNKLNERNLDVGVRWVTTHGDRWTFGANINAVVIGIAPEDTPRLQTVKISMFAGFNEGNLHTGVFLSCTVPFIYENGQNKALSPIVHFQHQMRWTLDKTVSFSVTTAFASNRETAVIGQDAKLTITHGKWMVSGTGRWVFDGSMNLDSKLLFARQFQINPYISGVVGGQLSYSTGAMPNLLDSSDLLGPYKGFSAPLGGYAGLHAALFF